MTSRKHSPEAIENMRTAAQRRITEKPWTIPSPPVGQKTFLGRTHTDESRLLMSASKRGELNSNYGKTGEDSPVWKGDKASYGSIHDWMSYHHGQPSECEECGTTDPDKRYEWANISGEYRRDRSDFRRLCKKCHNDMDGVSQWQQANHHKLPGKSTWCGKPVNSPYKGVTAGRNGTWVARCNGKRLGTFKTQEEAALVYNRAAREAWGSEAYQNEVPE